MIRYGLICDKEHEFEAWFRSGEDFETQKSRKLVSCPDGCGARDSPRLPAMRVA